VKKTNKIVSWLVGCALVGGVALAGAEERLKVGMVSDGGPFDDAGFNENCKEGLSRAMQEFKVFGYFREGFSPKDYQDKLTELSEKNYRLIVGVGYRMQDDLAVMAGKYTNTWFAIVDGHYEKPLPNVMSLEFAVDQCAFPAGFLAAAWADLKDPDDPQVGFVGGVRTEIVEQFTAPYQAGVEYYNRKYGKQVAVLGEYSDTFNSASKGRVLAKALLEKGVDVIFGVGSKTGNGALAAAREKGKWGIGVDVDQYYSLVDEQAMLLTSCLKRMDNAVYAVVQAARQGTFKGGSSYLGTLENQGVGLAPYHAFEHEIPEQIKKDVELIRQEIVSGSLSTGWPVKPGS